MTARVAPQSSSIASGNQLRAGWIVSILLALFLLVDGIGRLFKFKVYDEGTVDAGFLSSQGPWIGAILIVCTLLYLVPRTAFFGAILLTGYLGGAVATNIRLEDYGPALFATAFGIIVWIGLTLRDGRIRQFLAN